MVEASTATAAVLGPVRATLAAALAGFGCMAAELTAVRLLAPHFGDSAYVWTNVIGVILAALAAGAWFGGRLAGRPTAQVWAGRCLLAAGGWTALSPWAASWLGAWLLPADLPLDAAMPAMVRGSFVATALLFGPAMLCIGAVSPLLVTAVVRGGREVGRTAGSMAAAGTLGSLAGTFAATHFLVPTFGCRVAMGLAGSLLAAAGLLVGPRRTRVAGGVVLLLAGFATALHQGPLRQVASGSELLAEVESRSQFLQVVRDLTAAPARTALVINEGLDSFHSLALAGSAFTGGAYYDWHALAPLLAGDGQRPAGLRALSIGDAAGTLRAVYAGVHPGAQVDAVDIDGAAMALGDRFFPGPKAAGGRFVVDGRVFLAASRERWHVVHVDAYAHQVYVPAHLASREFFVAARERLLDGGVLACNVGALHDEDPVLRAIGTTMAEVFGHALAVLVPNSRNALLVARRGPAPTPAAFASFAFGREQLTDDDLAHWRWLVATAASARWVDVGRGGERLLDDRPVLDRLLAASYIDRRDAATLLACEGAVDAAGAELTAYGSRQQRDWRGVLAAVAVSRAPSFLLREWAGDARWSLRELRSAAAEYAAALVLAPDAEGRARVQGKADTVAAELLPVARAEEASSRNGWLQLAVLVVAILGVGLGRRCA